MIQSVSQSDVVYVKGNRSRYLFLYMQTATEN